MHPAVTPSSSCSSAFSSPPLWLPVGVVGSLSILIVDLRVLALGPGIREQQRLHRAPAWPHRAQALSLAPESEHGAHVQHTARCLSNIKSQKKAQSHMALSGSSLMPESSSSTGRRGSALLCPNSASSVLQLHPPTLVQSGRCLEGRDVYS